MALCVGNVFWFSNGLRHPFAILRPDWTSQAVGGLAVVISSGLAMKKEAIAQALKTIGMIGVLLVMAFLMLALVQLHQHRAHSLMLQYLKIGQTERDVIRRFGPPRRILSENMEIDNYVSEGNYEYSEPLLPLNFGEKVLAYQSAYNTRILVCINTKGRIARVISGGT